MIRNNDFLKAIIAQPDDNAIRLVYADWLEEQGEAARAELIRLQIELACTTESQRRISPARVRVSQLIYQHQAAWKKELPTLPKGAFWGGYERGFARTLTSDLGPHLAAITEETLNTTPYDCLHLHATNRVHRLSGSPLLARTRTLSVQRNSFQYPPANRDDALLQEIISWPECAQLRAFELHSVELSATQIQAIGQVAMPQLRTLKWANIRASEPLINAVWLGQLEELELSSFPATDEQYRPLWARLSPQRLRRLTVRASKLNDVALESLIQSGLVEGLELLDLETNDIGPSRLRLLLSMLPATCYLAIENNPLGEEGLIALANSPALRHYASMPRIRGAIGDRGFQALAASPYAENMTSIFYNHGTVGTLGLSELLHSPTLSGMRSITLGYCMIAELPASQHPTLAGLHLGFNQLTDAGLARFARDSRLPQLEYLSLENNQLGMNSAQALANAQGFPKLKSLLLRRNPLGDAGGIALLNGSGLPALTELHLEDCQLTDRMLQQGQHAPRLRQLKKIRLRSEENRFSDEIYETFCEHAYQLGCDVDHWSLRPRLRSIRRPHDRGPLAVADRLALAEWITGMQYAEYARVAWLKVATMDSLHRQAERADQEILDDYRHAPQPTDQQCRNALHYFLEHWMCGCVPESVSGGWSLSPDEFQRHTLADVRPLVEAIIETSTNDENGYIEGCPPHYITGDETPRTFVLSSSLNRERISYEHVRRWFLAELFDPATVIFMVNTGPPIRVIGMDQHLIAQLWLD